MKHQRDELRAERDLLLGEKDQLREQVRRLEAGKRGVDQGGQIVQQRKRGPKLLPWSDLGIDAKKDETKTVVAEMEKVVERRQTTVSQVAAHIAYR